ncbi:MAG: ATP-binding protein [Gammaproteobacteria bacterium]|nr:ATP-binding protein [Gammaproteobacteria bacterium]
MSHLLETLLEEAFATVRRTQNSLQRHYQFPKADNMIKVAVGMRRTGKTYFLYQTINQLLQEGVTQEQILMINFEDDRLLPMTAKEMGELLDSFFSLYPANHDRCCYLFLDEIQNVKDWHRVVRRYFDSKYVQLYLTGSSSKLLSKEINTSLRGRSLALEIWPYSFSEYLEAQHITPEKKPLGQRSLDIMQQHLKNYFFRGGFPAVQHLFENEWREALQGYIDTVILRDIIERHNVTNISLLKYLITTLLNNAATLFSVNKFYNDIKNQGYRVGKGTIHNYLEYIQDAFLVFFIPIYSESTRKKQNTPKKIYAIDSGLIKATSTNVNDIYGKLLENLIYLELRKQNKKIYFYHTRDGYEIDFVTVDKKGERELIQVAWDLDENKAEEREKRALLQAEEELGIKGKIITAKEYLKTYHRV